MLKKLVEGGGSALIIFVVTLVFLYEIRHGRTQSEAMAWAAVAAFGMSFFFFIISFISDPHTSTPYAHDECGMWFAAGFYTGALGLIASVSVSSPLIVSILCTIVVVLLICFSWWLFDDNLKLDWWAGRAMLTPAGVFLAFYAEFGYNKTAAEAVLLVMLLVQFVWTLTTWKNRWPAAG
jgi:hypothetical protein